MNAISRIEAAPQVIPFNAYAAYEREREWSREVETRLNKALQLLSMECTRREGRGEDVAHIRAFIREASR